MQDATLFSWVLKSNVEVAVARSCVGLTKLSDAFFVALAASAIGVGGGGNAAPGGGRAPSAGAPGGTGDCVVPLTGAGFAGAAGADSDADSAA
jgi:hypothetical protein